MNPLLEQYISGDKGGFLELIPIIAAHTDNRPALSLRAESPNEYPRDVRKAAARAKDVTQRRKGYVSFIY